MIVFIYSGTVIARDGDQHRITARELAGLYGINPRHPEVELVEWRSRHNTKEKWMRPMLAPHFKHLFPLPDGNYPNMAGILSMTCSTADL